MPDSNKICTHDEDSIKYCSKCLSIKVLYEEDIDAEYCGDCGCSDISESPFDVWEQKYEKKYGHKFAVKNEDPKKSFIFSLTTEELKTKVFKSERWKEIIRSLYPRFPGGLSKADSIILFFHTLIKDNRINDLKYLLLKLFKY